MSCTFTHTIPRRPKKRNVRKLKEDAFKKAFEKELPRLVFDKWQLLTVARAELSKRDAKALLIDLSFANPYSPYELEYKEKDLLAAAAKVGQYLGLTDEEIDAIWKTRKDALDSHSAFSWSKVVLMAVGGGVILALGGWAVAPVLGAYLGAAGTGLAGAAAIAHGLALIGGGSLAFGGLGMAGGMWIVVGASALGGTLAAGGGTVLFQLGSGAAKIELVKLQISFKEITLAEQVNAKVSQAAIKALEKDRKELEEKLEQERKLNDKNSSRIDEIEKILKTMEKATSWMKKQQEAAA